MAGIMQHPAEYRANRAGARDQDWSIGHRVEVIGRRIVRQRYAGSVACGRPIARSQEVGMERTSIRLGGVEIGSSVMNASGARSAERGEIIELCAVHSGAIVFKSCNRAGLETPENLKNRGVEYFQAIAGELVARNKKVVGSVVGASEEEFIDVARMLDRAGVSIVELNLADDYVTKSVAPFASFERLKSLLGRVRGETGCVLAVKVPPRAPFEPRAIADLFKSMRIAIAVCANDLPKGSRSTSRVAKCKERRARCRRRTRSSTRAKTCSTSSQSAESTRAATPTSRI